MNRNMQQRLLSFALAFLLLLSILPMSTLAAEDEKRSGTCGENLTWTLEDGLLTISGKGDMDDYSIKIGSGGTVEPQVRPWADYIAEIQTIEIKSGVTSIGVGAFFQCSALTAVSIPESVTRIGADAFSNCTELQTISLPSGITAIEPLTFGWCTDLAKIEIPQNVTSIGDRAFIGCSSLTEITIPEKVTQIGREVFWYCDHLGYLRFLGDAPVMDSDMLRAGMEITAFYPQDNDTWTSDVLQDYGGTITWKTGVPLYVTNRASDGKPKLTWDAMEGAELYKVYRATSKNGRYSLVRTANGTSYTNTNTEAGKTYYYKLKVILEGGDTLTSDIVSITCALPRPVVKASNDAATGSVVLRWEEVTGAEGYTIYRSNTKIDHLMTIETVDETEYVFEFAPCNTPICFYVRAIHEKEAANSALSSVVMRNADLPRPVVTASNVASSGKIKLTWDAVHGAEKYYIYRRTGTGGEYKYLTSTTKTSFVNTSAEVGTAYYYKVKAVHSNTSANSAQSVAVGRTCDLARPVITTSNVASSGKIKISWDAIDGAEKYYIYRATSKDGEYGYLTSTTKTTITNTSVEAGEAYYYKVKAVHSNTNANSALSAASGRTCDLARPVVSISLSSSGKPKLTWDAIDGAVKYYIYRSTSENGEYKYLTSTTKTSLTNTSAEAGTTYYYKVKAVHSNTNANSAYSSMDSITSK